MAALPTAGEGTRWNQAVFCGPYFKAVHQRQLAASPFQTEIVNWPQEGAWFNGYRNHEPIGNVGSPRSAECSVGWLQYALEGVCHAYANTKLYPQGFDGEPAVVCYTLATWRAAAGLHVDGFTRKYRDPNTGNIVTAHGLFTRGDFIGPWIWNEIKAGVECLLWTAGWASNGWVQAFRVSEQQGKYAEGQDWIPPYSYADADAVATANWPPNVNSYGSGAYAEHLSWVYRTYLSRGKLRLDVRSSAAAAFGRDYDGYLLAVKPAADGGNPATFDANGDAVQEDKLAKVGSTGTLIGASVMGRTGFFGKTDPIPTIPTGAGARGWGTNTFEGVAKWAFADGVAAIAQAGLMQAGMVQGA